MKTTASKPFSIRNSIGACASLLALGIPAGFVNEAKALGLENDSNTDLNLANERVGVHLETNLHQTNERQLELCNNTPFDSLRIAIGFEDWNSRNLVDQGWFKVPAGECQVVLSDFSWHSSSVTVSSHFTDNKFDIAQSEQALSNAAKVCVIGRDPEYRWERTGTWDCDEGFPRRARKFSSIYRFKSETGLRIEIFERSERQFERTEYGAIQLLPSYVWHENKNGRVCWYQKFGENGNRERITTKRKSFSHYTEVFANPRFLSATNTAKWDGELQISELKQALQTSTEPTLPLEGGTGLAQGIALGEGFPSEDSGSGFFDRCPK